MKGLFFIFLFLNITSVEAYEVLNHRYIINNTEENIVVTYDRCANMYQPSASCESNLKISIPSKSTHNNIGKIELRPGDNNSFFVTKIISPSRTANFANFGDVWELSKRGYSGNDIRTCYVSADYYPKHIIIDEYANHKISCRLIDLFT